LIRHRTAQVNEYSMRYSEAIDEFHFPAPRAQDKTNKQQSVENKFDPETEIAYQQACIEASSMIKTYQSLIKKGIAREVSRSILCTARNDKNDLVHGFTQFIQISETTL
jgi:thymidylate synthase (FAD)